MVQTVLTKDTLIPVGAVIIVLSAAFSYGAMYNKVNALSGEVALLRQDNREINSKLDQLIGRVNISYGGSTSN